MSALRPVSFAKPRVDMPRLSTPYVPGKRHERYWTPEQDDIIRKYYPDGGFAACAAHLSEHKQTKSGVYLRAAKLGVKSNREGGAPKVKIVAPPGFDDMLREFYQNGDGKKKGEVNAFADRIGLPRWWITHRARRLGLVIPHKKEPPWTAAENKLMEKVPLHDVDECSKIFRQYGFQRSATAIQVMAKRLNLSRRYNATFSATSAARIIGLHCAKGVTREIIQGRLKAERRPSARLPQQGGDPWSIARVDLRTYIIANLQYVDFRKVDKFALVDVLTNDGTKPKKPDGRSKPWSPERKEAQARRMKRRWRKAVQPKASKK